MSEGGKLMGRRNVECPKCDRLFKDEHGLKQHLADFHGDGKRPRSPERYPLYPIDFDQGRDPRQFPAGCWEED